MTEPVAGTPAAPTDLVAILSSLQDQIDDLTAAVEELQRRVNDRPAGPPPAAPKD